MNPQHSAGVQVSFSQVQMQRFPEKPATRTITTANSTLLLVSPVRGLISSFISVLEKILRAVTACDLIKIGLSTRSSFHIIYSVGTCALCWPRQFKRTYFSTELFCRPRSSCVNSTNPLGYPGVPFARARKTLLSCPQRLSQPDPAQEAGTHRGPQYGNSLSSQFPESHGLANAYPMPAQTF